ncbi:H-NS histone family protein [Paracoccus sp. TOH]|uniref:H-NS histone family protein n=1 Tax=Paracoccus sp. TOH TaxID=1263728 RepID=UPI0025AFD74B|nr:H-NS histone family protein [Paracoccus sp. TOH]WJS84202.1 H-NS histone family protein [Paracoccus sp. TOH]
MTDPDVNAMPLAELKQLRKDVEKAIDGYATRRMAEARAKAEEAVKEFGFSLAELVEAAAPRPASVAKYRHPENPTLTWSGRGRKPGWIADALAAGKSLGDFAI